ncbi:MAG: V-type ATPase subunit [Chloroflexi bacterium]|nr:V-type ATPase subunit [Chloroflexota bacterium]
MPTAMDAIRYAGANAGVRALSAQLLDEATWRELIGAENLQRVLVVLAETAYAESVTGVEQEAYPLQQIERRLSGQAARRVRQVMTFVRGAVKELLIVWWRHFELENLKSVFRGVAQGLDPEVIQRFLIPLGAESRLPWGSLVHERSVSSLVERTAGTHYINPLRNALPAYEREGSIFAIEVALDIRYYRDLDAAIGHLKGQDYADARMLLGTHIDMLNILWAFRYRVYYGLSPEEIVNYTLWHGIRTDIELIRRIALGATPEEILTEIWPIAHLDLSSLAELDDARKLPELENILLAYWRKLASAAMRGYPFRLAALLGYLILQELEIQDLVTLLEGKAMGWTDDRIERQLIRSRG